MGFFAGCCSGDVVVEAKQATQQLDSAIKASEDAWVNGAAQTQVLKTILTFADPKAQATQDAQALETSYESQLATYNATLNDLQADRAIMVNVLTTYQQAMLQKINNYKTAYVGQMGSINAQIKLVQDVIITIQNLLADSPMTDAKVRTISDAQGKAQGALSGIGDALHSLISLDTKIDSDMAGFQLQDATQAKVFSDWWAEQKAWVKQTQAAVDARIQYLSQLGAQMEQKQKDFNAQQEVQKQLDAAAVD